MIEYFISTCQNENIFNECDHDIKYFNVAIIRIIEEILTTNKSTDINFILNLIQKKILKQYDFQIAQQKQLEKKEKHREANFLNLTKEHVLKELYDRHTMQYLFSSNIWKNKDDYESRIEEDNSFNISKIIPTKEIKIKKSSKNGNIYT